MNITYYELSNYNNGRLIAKTFDLSGKTFEDHELELQDWLIELTDRTGSLCEEWIVADYESIPSRYVSEWTISKEAFDYIELVEEGSISEDVINAGVELGIPLDKIQNAYWGHYDSPESFGYEYAENYGLIEKIPVEVSYYIDWDSYARDLIINYFMEENDHYFYNNW